MVVHLVVDTIAPLRGLHGRFVEPLVVADYKTYYWVDLEEL